MKENAQKLIRFIEENAMTRPEAGNHFGVGPAAIGQWMTANEVPGYVTRIIRLHETIAEARSQRDDARRESKVPTPTKTVVITGEPSKVDALIACSDQLGLTSLNI